MLNIGKVKTITKKGLLAEAFFFIVFGYNLIFFTCSA
ncbi:MAG: hypothetical protein IIW27_00220 [Clostridia bacterium]|nr:hypothetical protein [Clostridia bacterium]